MLWLLTIFVAGIAAWPVSNRTSCFKYIDCLEQTQITFKKCSRGTVSALTSETRDRLFLAASATHWNIVEQCQQDLELEGLDFDSLQALVNEDSRQCFRRMHKRKMPLDAVCEVPEFPVAPEGVQTARFCLTSFRDNRKMCEKLLDCCPEHVKCAERLTKLSIAYQEAKKKSINIADRMLGCVYESLGLAPPPTTAVEGDFARKHRNAEAKGKQQNVLTGHQSSVRFIKKERKQKKLKKLPVATTESPHAYATIKGSDFPVLHEQVEERQREKYADKLIAGRGQQRPLETDSGMEPAVVVTEAPKIEKPVVEEATKKVILNDWKNLSVESRVEKEKILEEMLETTPEPVEDATTETPTTTEAVAPEARVTEATVILEQPEVKVEVEEAKKMLERTDPFETYDDGTKLDEEIGVDFVSPSTTVAPEATSEISMTSTSPSSSSTSADPQNVSFEIVPDSHEKEKTGALPLPETLEAIQKKSAEEVATTTHRVELVKFLLSTADPTESQYYLKLVAENRYDELQKIADQKKIQEKNGPTDKLAWW
ncbi:unnamed protein product, partial [Mesorhabditis spiculigera]